MINGYIPYNNWSRVMLRKRFFTLFGAHIRLKIFISNSWKKVFMWYTCTEAVYRTNPYLLTDSGLIHWCIAMFIRHKNTCNKRKNSMFKLQIVKDAYMFSKSYFIITKWKSKYISKRIRYIWGNCRICRTLQLKSCQHLNAQRWIVCSVVTFKRLH